LPSHNELRSLKNRVILQVIVTRPKKPLIELTKEAKRKREYFIKYPEKLEKRNKQTKEWIIKNQEKFRKQKRETQKKRWIEAVNMLGDKCESCGEKNNSENPLEIHHLYYDDQDKIRREKWGGVGEIFRYVLRMAKQGKNPKGKFTLLCKQCNNLEAWIRKNPDRALSAFAWCVEKGIIDVETPNPEGNKQLDEFIKQ